MISQTSQEYDIKIFISEIYHTDVNILISEDDIILNDVSDITSTSQDYNINSFISQIYHTDVDILISEDYIILI